MKGKGLRCAMSFFLPVSSGVLHGHVRDRSRRGKRTQGRCHPEKEMPAHCTPTASLRPHRTAKRAHGSGGTHGQRLNTMMSQQRGYGTVDLQAINPVADFVEQYRKGGIFGAVPSPSVQRRCDRSAKPNPTRAQPGLFGTLIIGQTSGKQRPPVPTTRPLPIQSDFAIYL